jgi:heptosyltransferase I
VKIDPSSPPKSICLLRISAIGDITHMVPLVRTFQTFWPATRLTWIVGRNEAELVCDIQNVEFIIFEKSKGWRAFHALRQQLSDHRFDALLHMQVSARANLASLFVKAPVRLGYDRARAKDLHRLFVNQHIPPGNRQHVLEGFFSFAETLGLHRKQLRWDIPLPAEAQAYAQNALPGNQPTLIISPCSSHRLRNWSAARYAKVADYAANVHNMRVALCGGPSQMERDYGDAIARYMKTVPINLIGKDTLKRMLTTLARATVIVCPDSGPAHMATCVGTPVIGLYAASNVQRSGPYLSRHWCVDRYDAAARKFTNQPASALPWGTKLEYPGTMELITVEDVLEKLDALMSQRKRNVFVRET